MKRVECMVLDCRRTMGHDVYRKRFGCDPGGWICPTHWRLVPTAWKRIEARFKRQERRFGGDARPAARDRLWRAIYRVIGA